MYGYHLCNILSVRLCSSSEGRMFTSGAAWLGGRKAAGLLELHIYEGVYWNYLENPHRGFLASVMYLEYHASPLVDTSQSTA